MILSTATMTSAQSFFMNKPYEITVSDDKLIFTGMFFKGVAGQIIREMTANNLKILVMNSPGGLMKQAEYLANFVKSQNIEIQIPENAWCVSACAFAAIASDKIVFAPGSALLFHAPYLDSVSTNRSLEEIMVNHSRYINSFNRVIDSYGYGFDFWELILTKSSRTKMIMIASQKDLFFFKVEHYMDSVGPYSDRYQIVDVASE